MRVACGLLLFAALGVAQEPLRHEDLIKETISALERMTVTLTSILDRKTAEDAVPELRKNAEAWRELRKKAESLPPPERPEKDRLAKEYKTKMDETQKKFYGEIARIQFIQGGRIALVEVQAILKKPGE